MKQPTVLALALAGLLLAHSGHTAEPKPAAGKLKAVPAEQVLAGGSLRFVNVYRAQALVLQEMAGRPQAEVIDRLVQEVFRPYPELWAGYLGEEKDFREWAVSLLAGNHPIQTKLGAVLDLDLTAMFEKTASRFVALTGRRPQGTWYVLFGPGWTNMGGIGEGRMVIDFSNIEPRLEAVEFLLPHELNHQVHSAGHKDPDDGTVLERTVGEGFATYVNYLYWDQLQSPARNLFYKEEEWTWSLAHEAELFAALQPILFSKERTDLNTVADRSLFLVKGGPSAAGIF